MKDAPIEQLLQDVRARAFRRRLAAVTALSDIEDPRADEALLGALSDRSLRFVALRSLIARDRNRDIRPIIEALRGGSGAEWKPPDAWEIIHFGIIHLTQANAAEVLGEALTTSDDRQLRHEAAIHLGKLRDARAVPAFVEALGDPHDPVRRESARGLGYIADPRAVPALLSALDDPYRAVRRVAGRALAKIGVPMREVLRFRPQTEPGRQGRRKLLRRVLVRKLLFFRR